MASFEETDAKHSTHNAVRIDCSVVVPLYNESAVVQELYERLTKTLASTGLYYELIFIDDGSKDNTLQLLKEISFKDSKVVVIELRRTFGQTPALAAGFDIALYWNRAVYWRGKGMERLAN
jgi:glycosyltransferase involved in cell wall biosynthesis